MDRVYQAQPEARVSVPPHRTMEISVSVLVTGQTGLRILLTQWQQANRVVLDGAP
jgi:hypothetical protein